MGVSGNFRHALCVIVMSVKPGEKMVDCARSCLAS